MKISKEHWHASVQQGSQAMRRVVIGSVVIVVFVAAFYIDPGDIAACKGHCWTQGTPVATSFASPPPAETPPPPDYTPSPEERCEITDGSISLLALAEFDPESGRPLCLMEVALSPAASSQSITDPGGVEAYYVQTGTIAFRLDSSVNAGVVRVIPGPNDEPPALEQLPDGSYQATSGDEFTISTGGSVSIDGQDSQVAMEYSNAGEGDATLLISSALPATESVATPEP
jgi:hypothetical protein